MSQIALTAADVNRLLTDPSEQARAETAVKIAQNLESQTLTPEQQRMAQEIIRTLAKDAAVMVRQSIVACMKSSVFLPTDVAEKLAVDLDSLALPILQESPSLSDPFLMQIIREMGETHQVAIASRSGLSNPVATQLIAKGTEAVVGTLVRNQTAKLEEHNIAHILERFENSPAVVDGLAERQKVPPSILEYMVAKATDALRAKITARSDYQKQIDEVFLQGRERATSKMIGDSRTDEELEQVARQMLETSRLTASFILRTLCEGDMRFFEVCMAVAAKLPLKNARVLIHDQGATGLSALYACTKLSPDFLPAIYHALAIAQETDFDGGAHDWPRYRRRLIERILTDPRGMTREDVEYLVARLSDFGDRAPAS